MSFVLTLQESSQEREQNRDLSTMSNWLCYSTGSWWLC